MSVQVVSRARPAHSHHPTHWRHHESHATRYTHANRHVRGQPPGATRRRLCWLLVGADRTCSSLWFGEYLSGIVVTPRYAARCKRDLALDTAGCSPWRESEEDTPLWDALYDGEESPSIARVVLDNGAFSAWQTGCPLSLSDQLDGIDEAMVELGASVEWIVAPDVVADARATWERLIACQHELEPYGLDRLLLPVQDGMDIPSVASLARELQAGIFVGGSDWTFKTRESNGQASSDLDEQVEASQTRTIYSPQDN